jgi:LuxR family maltose regulon positive regulatory protein
MVEQYQLDAYVESTVAYVAAARLAIHDGDHAGARAFATLAARLRPLITYAVPCTTQFLLELGQLYLELADPTGALAVLRQVRDILYQRPELGEVATQVARLRAEAEAARIGSVSASSLTVAELRVLPYLTTHLSLAEIGERLHISRNTVKTHSIAIYRKLGVSTRSDAIERAREVGLLST